MGRLTVIDGVKLNLAEVVILVAGGNPAEVDVLMQVFAGFGARQLRRADNAKEINDALVNGVIDLLVVDAMIGMEFSMEVVRNLRRLNSDSRYAPVILTTANALPSLIREARENGVNYIVAKPLAPRTLFERLIWVVKDRRDFIESEAYHGPDRRIRAVGPPAGMAGRRVGDLPPDVGDASTPNLSQADIDAMMMPVRKTK